MKRPQSIALDFDGTIFAGEFVRPDVVDGPPVPGAMPWLRKQLRDGVTITIHTCRLTPANSDSRWREHCSPMDAQRAIECWLSQWLSPTEVGALLFWTLPDDAPISWRRWAELALGDAPTVRAATDQDLRRAIKQRLDAMAHTIEVMAEAARAGDVDAVRMHHEHVAGGEPDLSVEAGPSIFWPAQNCGKCGQSVGGEVLHSDGVFYHPACLGVTIAPPVDDGEECPF